MAPIWLSSNLSELGRVAQFAEELAVRGGLDQRRGYHLRLAADELATNIITHGYGDGRPGKFQLDGGVSADRVWLRLIDAAPPFDPHLDGPDVDLEIPLGERELGGLGLHLVRSVVDDFEYRFEQGHNCQTIAIRRGEPLTGSSNPEESS